HPELTMRAHPDWVRRTDFPITRICLWSERPIEAFDASRLKIWSSQDNRRYTLYRGPRRLRVGRVSRPHYRWTPAGKVAESSKATNWRIEISELSLRHPFAAIEIEGKRFEIRHRMFAFAEVWGSERVDGGEAPVELACAGDRTSGFSFNKSWLG